MSEEQVAEVSAPEMEQEVAQSVEDWRSNIPEEIRGHKSLQHINDVGALAKSYVHAQSMIGADKVVVPGKSATPDEWNEFYARLGRPESPDAYELPQQEGAEVNPDMSNWYKQMAHEIGLNSTQAAKLYESYNQFISNFQESTAVDHEMHVREVETNLRREFGQAFDDRMALGNGVVEQFGASDLMEVELADGTLLGDNPDVIRMMSNIGVFMKERLGEDTLEGIKTNGGLTPEQARDKLSELTASSSPYWDSRHPEHDWYVQEAMKFREITNG